jgi:hypothetical protein
MFIHYKGTNVHAFPLVQTKLKKFTSKKTGKKYTKEVIVGSQSPQDVYSLRPGWNEFPKNVWDQNKNNPGIVKMIEKKKIVVLNETIIVKEGKKNVKKVIGQDDEPIDLMLLTIERSLKIIKDTYNPAILSRWLDEDSRHKVKQAITKQIKPLINEAKDDDSEDEEEDEDFE